MVEKNQNNRASTNPLTKIIQHIGPSTQSEDIVCSVLTQFGCNFPAKNLHAVAYGLPTAFSQTLGITVLTGMVSPI